MKSNNKEKDRIVAYIDLLAFSNHVRKNTGDAMMVFSNYNTILHSKIRDSIAHPVDSYSSELQELARNTSIDSFEYFIPFSDSIFIVSDDVNSFIPQLSSFVYGCFHITSHFYINPQDSSDPTKGEMVSFSFDDNNNLSSKYIDSHYYPTIFRGGMAYGEVFPIELWNIVDKGPEKRKSLAGKAVVRAVELESKIKGPRIVFDIEMFEQIDEQIKNRYIRKIEGTEFYEILWPAIKYIPQNGFSDAQSFYEMFTCAINLWKGYNHTPYSMHYFSFIELIVASTLQFFEAIGYKNEALEMVKTAIKQKGLEDKITILIP
ncbi:hypothetical protein [Sanguibacteroides justesenii]|uniref:hypothetical protein n=1 Tax=Sanguibacteroides justesenii TaxID=1547597 RepID=UPI0005A079A0|nr:hypothetical protein [Sanguibacteroides justesenii]